MTDWVISLEEYTQNYDSWSVYYYVISLEERDDVIPSECYTLLIFYDDISNDEIHGKTTKLDTGHELIEIYNNNLTTEQLTSVTSHEIGHIFGLDHYVTDNEDLETSWEFGNDIPSIMIEFTPLANDLKITELDLEMMISLYDYDGFDGLPLITPEWILNIYSWRDSGLIEAQELTHAINYLVENDIIQII